MVKTFPEWKNAVIKESEKLRDVRDYLNDEGRARLRAFSLLADLAHWSDNASEMWDFLTDTENLDASEQRTLRPAGNEWNGHLAGAISRLKTIRKNELML